MEINIEKLKTLTGDAAKIFLTPEGEQALVDLLDIQDQVEKAIEEAQKTLEEAALKINPNFNSIQADRVKVYYRAYGAKYYVDPSKGAAPLEIYKTEVDIEAPNDLKDGEIVHLLESQGFIVKVKDDKPAIKKVVDADAVEKYAKDKGGLPIGIAEAPRTKSLKFSLKEKKEK